MGQQQTTTKVITLIYDVRKTRVAHVESLWQSYLRDEVKIEQVLKEMKEWLVESKMIP